MPARVEVEGYGRKPGPQVQPSSPTGREQQQEGSGPGAEGAGFPTNAPNLHSWVKMRTPPGPSLLASFNVKYQTPGSLGQLPPCPSDSGYDSDSRVSTCREQSPTCPGGPAPSCIQRTHR